MDKFWIAGNNYMKSNNPIYLNQIAVMLNLTTLDISKSNPNQYAKMFLYWMNYIIDEFILHQSDGGTPTEAGLSLFATQAIYNAYSKVREDYIYFFLI